MSDNSLARGAVKFSLGAAAGFGLYFLIRNLRLGGGFGLGGESPSAGPSGSSREPSTPSIPRDEKPLLFVVVHPDGFTEAAKLPDPTERARRDAVFRRLDLGTAEVSADDVNRRMSDVLRREREKGTSPLLLDDVIARIRAGGRDDVRLITTGNIRSGTWDDVKDALMATGIKHWLLWQEYPADRRPGVPSKPSRWDLYDKVSSVGNPDVRGHYLVENRGSAYWNLAAPGSSASSPHVSGHRARGQYGTQRFADRGYYRGHGR